MSDGKLPVFGTISGAQTAIGFLEAVENKTRNKISDDSQKYIDGLCRQFPSNPEASARLCLLSNFCP
jgi:hypothetical protein